MPGQLGADILIAAKPEVTFNTAPGASGATQLRWIDSPGLNLTMTEIKSAERRGDLLDTLSRMGSRHVAGSFRSEMIVGAHDLWYEAIWRATFVAAVTITEATAGLTSITTTTSTIVAAAGSWITAGVRVGDVIRLTGHSTPGNNSKNLRVKGVSALTITLYGTPLTADAVADTAFTITIGKKLSNPTVPVRRSFYVEQYYRTIDQSAVYGGVRYTGMSITGAPNQMAQVDFSAMGASLSVLDTAASPYYSSPTLPTGGALVFSDASIAFGGSDVVNLTNLSLNLQIAASTLDVIGSTTTPDVYDNKMTLTGSISAARQDLARLLAYQNETALELHAMLVEPESEPKDYIALFIPNLRLTGNPADLGGDGAMIEQLPFTCGVKEGAAATGYDTTLINFLTSAA